MIKTFCENVSRKLFILVAGVLALLGSLCSLVSVRAADTETAPGNFQVTIAEVPVLKIVLSSATASMTVTPSQGGPGFNTADLAVTVGTSSTAGYTLKMATSNNGALISGGNSMPTLDGATDTSGNNYTCTIATATNCNFTTNSWGFRLSTDTANAFKGAPVESTEIVSYTDGATNGEVTNLQFGARVDADLPAGAYGTTVNFTAVANAELPDINDISTMQDFAALNSDELQAVVDSMAADTSYTLADSRDDNSYTIQKLADGNIWMLDNLALGGSSAMTLDSTNTNLADNTTYILPASGTQCFTNQNTTCTGTDGTTTGNGYTLAAINADYKNATHKKDDPSATFTYNSNGDVSKAGVYYNYCAASAGTICDAASSNNNNAQYDICPKGWRLPTGGGSGEFRALANNLGNVTTGNLTGDAYTAFKAAFHAGLSGWFLSGYVQLQTSSVYFWSSTRYDGYSMYYLSLNTTTVNPQGYNNRHLGYSVRCVLKSTGLDTNITFDPNGADSGSVTTLTLTSGSTALPTSGSLDFSKNGYIGVSWNTAPDGSGTTYAAGTPVTAGMNGLTLYAQWSAGSWMQNLAYNSCTTTAQTVYDVRDGKPYTIQRLKLTTSNSNGLCWMLDNLQLDIAANKANITSANTNANDTALGYLKNGGGSSPYTTDAAVNTSASAWSGDVRYTKAMYNTEYADYDASYGNGTHKSGYYYNYCAASAGSYCYAVYAGTGNASQDICPAGWQMPAGDTSTYSYQKLYEAYGSNAANFKNALRAGLSGLFIGDIYNQGGYGFFWASTFHDTSAMRILYVGASSVSPQSASSRDNGYSVRCVLKATQ